MKRKRYYKGRTLGILAGCLLLGGAAAAGLHFLKEAGTEKTGQPGGAALETYHQGIQVMTEAQGEVLETTAREYGTEGLGVQVWEEDTASQDPAWEEADSQKQEAQVRDEDSWSLVLVNRWNPIPEDWQVELVTLNNGEQVDARIYPALQAMFDDARAESVYPIVASGYRTREEQEQLMAEKLAEYEGQGYSAQEAKEKAESWVAIPGTSEHQMGIAVDINADGIYSSGDQVYGWLAENAYRYGFIRRYPEDKTEITGVIHEPWHYRYVGTEAAKEIQEKGVCLEEYLGAA